MLKGLGLTSLCVLVAAAVTAFGNFFGDNFSVTYARENAVEILATVFALNVATATFLIGTLLNIEDRAKMSVFDKARKEIAHNLYTMAALFVVNLFLVACVKEHASANFIPLTQIPVNSVLAAFVIGILLFYIYLLMEIVSAAFKLRAPNIGDS